MFLFSGTWLYPCCCIPLPEDAMNESKTSTPAETVVAWYIASAASDRLNSLRKLQKSKCFTKDQAEHLGKISDG